MQTEMMKPEFLAALIAVITLAGGGWGVHLHLRTRQIDALFRWKDAFVKEFADHQLATVRDFAAKQDMKDGFDSAKKEVKEGFEKMDHRLESLERKIDQAISLSRGGS